MPRSSKSSAPKAFDVIAPGKVAPSPTSRPIIVTNRPIIKDPMAPSEAVRPVQAAPSSNPEVASHVGKAIAPTVPPAAVVQEDKAEEGMFQPQPAASDDVPAVALAAVASKEDGHASSVQATAEKEVAAPSAQVNTSVPAPADSIADDDKKDSSIDRPQPGDVAAAEKASASEKAAAAERDEEEKIIVSEQYYLPIADGGRRRGLQRAMLTLLFVIILGLVWLDVAMDAGILHIHGLQPLTHFFSAR